VSAIDQLADAYLKGAADLRAAVAGMTRDQLVARPVPGKWSTLEVVCHIADFEPVLVDRMKRIIAKGDTPPLLLAADEDEYAKALAYHDRDAEEELALVEALRRSTARILRTLTASQLQEQGVHNLRGLMTLERVVQLATNHIPHHLPFIAAKRQALGIA
jgi:uncharacterized damage-inducible protein DinB